MPVCHAKEEKRVRFRQGDLNSPGISCRRFIEATKRITVEKCAGTGGILWEFSSNTQEVKDNIISVEFTTIGVMAGSIFDSIADMKDKAGRIGLFPGFDKDALKGLNRLEVRRNKLIDHERHIPISGVQTRMRIESLATGGSSNDVFTAFFLGSTRGCGG